VPPVVTTEPITATQGQANSADPSIGSDAVIYPPPRGALNPNPLSLATLPQVWGFRRETWDDGAAGYIGSASGNDSWYVPLAWWHRAATLSAFSTCGLHFICDGRSLEVLFAGTNVQITLIADGKLMAPGYVTTVLNAGVPGATLSAPNAYVKLDFGYAKRRKVSLYAASSQGPCAIAVGKGDTLEPWDRSSETSFCAMTDSYGQAPGVNWPLGGPFWEAATQLGVTHLDLDAIGGTGYAPNPGNPDVRLAGNAFGARIASAAATRPDLFVTAGGINDNNSVADPPLYASPDAAKAGFEAAAKAYFEDLRAALPDSVLAAMGPWAPVESMPVSAAAQSKADAILAGLRAAGEPWVFLDNLNGGWINSSGAQELSTGRGWQTGTGNIAHPKGDGNGDQYVDAGGVHPTPDGCVYLGRMLAECLRGSIVAL
jgi:lysophospholipase L1-like esterase